VNEKPESPAEERGPFVLNLCELSAPVSIPQPRSPEFSRITFFCSRERTDGQESWWLRLGYFDTREDAEKWLERLRRMYPRAAIAEAEMTWQLDHFLDAGHLRGR
jgi:hypothetical protein